MQYSGMLQRLVGGQLDRQMHCELISPAAAAAAAAELPAAAAAAAAAEESPEDAAAAAAAACQEQGSISVMHRQMDIKVQASACIITQRPLQSSLLAAHGVADRSWVPMLML